MKPSELPVPFEGKCWVIDLFGGKPYIANVKKRADEAVYTDYVFTPLHDGWTKVIPIDTPEVPDDWLAP